MKTDKVLESKVKVRSV